MLTACIRTFTGHSTVRETVCSVYGALAFSSAVLFDFDRLGKSRPELSDRR